MVVFLMKPLTAYGSGSFRRANRSVPSSPSAQKVSPSGALIEDKWVRVGGVWYRSLEQETADSINLGG